MGYSPFMLFFAKFGTMVMHNTLGMTSSQAQVTLADILFTESL